GPSPRKVVPPCAPYHVHICPDDPQASQGRALPDPVSVGTTQEKEDHGDVCRAVSSQVWRRHPAHLDGGPGREKGELLHYRGVWHPGGFVVPGGAPHEAPRRYRRLSLYPIEFLWIKRFGVSRASPAMPAGRKWSTKPNSVHPRRKPRQAR